MFSSAQLASAAGVNIGPDKDELIKIDKNNTDYLCADFNKTDLGRR